MKSNYKAIGTANKNLYFVHRKIMENYIGRKLKFNEHVHHINGNSFDNRIENLELLSSSEHARKHMLNFYKLNSVEAKNRKEQCRQNGLNNRVLSDDIVNKILELFDNGFNRTEIAKKFNISRTQIYYIGNRKAKYVIKN